MALIGILLGALLSGGTSFCIGIYLLGRFLKPLDRMESFSQSFVVGSACFSQVLFLLCSVRLAYTGVFVAFGLLASFGAAASIRGHEPLSRGPLPRRWKWPFLVLFALFGTVYFVNALAPEMSPDGSAYHLPLVARYLGAHGFMRIPTNLYASFPQGIELLFLPAVSLGGHSAAAVVHLLFLVDLALLMVCYGRRFGFPVPALAAAFLVFASPVIGWDGTSAYNDVATATILFALFYLLEIWNREQTYRLLIPIGILAGGAYAAKYTGVIAVPYALTVITWRLRRSGRPVARSVLTVASVAALFILPWMIKNLIFVGNPVAPFENALFPNPHVHVSFEQQYRANLQNYTLTNKLQAPWELTVKGEKLQGFFGPVFVLTPLALLALRRRVGRSLVVAGIVFSMPWFFNIGTRFLIPALPPLTLALALALAHPIELLLAVALLHTAFSWYSTPLRSFDTYAPRLTSFPLLAALRVEPEDAYLSRRSSGYLVDRLIEREVPAGERVFSFDPVPEAWTQREIRIGYYSAENEVLGDILRTAMVPGLRPEGALDLSFPATSLLGLRIVRMGTVDAGMWHISELQLFSARNPILNNGSWHFWAYPNPWDAQLAFDNSMVTSWRSWRSATPGMFLAVRFSEPKTIDQVRLLAPAGTIESHVALQGMDRDGSWRDLPARACLSSAQITDDLRSAALRALRDRGIRYLLVSPGTLGANEFYENSAGWGIRRIGESGGTRLYALETGHTGSAPPETSAWKPAIPRGMYDDTDPRIVLHAPWVRDNQFREAFGHTLTYTSIPGASISFSFTGESITYIYTRAYNRGIAEVWIDDQLKDRVDLYAPSIEWQSKSTYAGLDPGPHTIRIRVTGEHSPKARDCAVDLDAVVVE
jgi:hypothetical protein